MELQQSFLYQSYIRALGWHICSVDGTAIFYRKLPIIGTIAKIQRPERLPYIPLLVMELKKYGVRQVSVEPKSDVPQEIFDTYLHSLSQFFRIIRSPFIPTKTILIDIQPPVSKIFDSFSSAKRRAVRKAQKNNVTVIESHHIHDLMDIKNKSAGMFGGITTYGIDKLWKLLYPKHVTILLAKHNGKTVGGILLLFWEHIVYYWIAGATKEGKKIFAPTLLVWEGIKMGKKHKCSAFDFVGVWDERAPKHNTEWKGFTKFKEGFGGKPFYYPISL